MVKLEFDLDHWFEIYRFFSSNFSFARNPVLVSRTIYLQHAACLFRRIERERKTARPQMDTWAAKKCRGLQN
jgi:hypothetical protein